MLRYLLDNYGWTVGLGTAAASIATMILGGSSVLKILGSVSEIAAPIGRWVVETLISGLKNILDSMATILTVVALCGGVYLYMQTRNVVDYNKLSTRTQVCEHELARVTKTRAPKEPDVWSLPFNWPF